MERRGVATPRDQGITEQCRSPGWRRTASGALPLRVQGGALTGGSSRFSLQLHAEETSIEHDAVGVGLPSGRARPCAETMGDAGTRSRLAGQRGQARAQRPLTGEQDDRRAHH
jgi:hypothetical protein